MTRWGFLDRLQHVETLLLSSVSREEDELVELGAVLEGLQGMFAKALVRLAIHANPQILGLHFSTILSHCICNLPKTFWASVTAKLRLASRVFLISRSFFLRSSFSDSILSSGNSSSGCISLLTSTKTSKAFLTSCSVPFCSMTCNMAMMWTRYSCCYCFQRRLSGSSFHPATWPWFAWVPAFCVDPWGGTYRMGGWAINVHFSHSE